MSADDPTVLYVMGRGHSGTTILDILLGNMPSVFGAGELLSGTTGTARDDCSCGTPVDDCEFWSATQRRFEEVAGVGAYAELVELSKQLNLVQNLPKFLVGKGPQHLIERYSELTRAWYPAIAAQSGADVVVDSSKELARGFLLLGAYDNVKVLHLVKHGEDVVSSRYERLKKGMPMPLMRVSFPSIKPLWPLYLESTVFTWVVGNLMCEAVAAKNPGRVQRVRYEDLVGDPANTLREIADWVGLDAQPVIDKIDAGEPLSIPHNIAGNQIRQKDSVVFKPSRGKRRPLPTVYRALAAATAAPLLPRYGYPLWRE